MSFEGHLSLFFALLSNLVHKQSSSITKHHYTNSCAHHINDKTTEGRLIVNIFS